MGWTSDNVNFRSKDSKMIKDFLLNEWNVDENFEALDYSKKGNTVYMAVKNLRTEAVFAVVTLISFEDGEFYWKDISEDMGPSQRECPKRILNLLTETDNEYALEWRKKCLEFHEKNRTLSTQYSDGDVLLFPEKISFTNGFEGTKFILFKNGRKTAFAPFTGQEIKSSVYTRYRITKWKQLEPEVIGHLD